MGFNTRKTNKQTNKLLLLVCTASTAVKAMCKNCSRVCGMIQILITILVSIAWILFKLNIRVFVLISSFFVCVVMLIRTQGKEPVILAVVFAFRIYWRPPNSFFLLRVSVLLVLYSAACLFIHLPVQIRLLLISLTCMELVDVDLFSCREVSPLFVFRGSRLPKCPLITTLL
jgi:hypothetical protein